MGLDLDKLERVAKAVDSCKYSDYSLNMLNTLMNPTDNIHTAILAVYKEVGYVQKTRKKGLNYSFAGEAQLIEALRPAMIEHGITAKVTNVRELKSTSYTTGSGTNMNHAILVADVEFRHAPSGTYVVVSATGEGADVGDKAFNKAMTSAYKYALRQTFMIETGDDPDKYPSEEMERASASEATDSGNGSLQDVRKEVVAIAKSLGGKTNAEMMKVIKAYVPSGNTNSITDVNVLLELKSKMEALSK